MEMILALVVAIAVLIFGALISMGNERQRRVIDELRKQVILWAMQDLRIKREKLVREVNVEDPLIWLNQVIIRASGEFLDLKIVEIFDNPHALVCATKAGERVVVSLNSPADIRRIKRERKSKLSRVDNRHPLLALPRRPDMIKISILNGGVLFDLELPMVWNALTQSKESNIQTLWVYK